MLQYQRARRDDAREPGGCRSRCLYVFDAACRRTRPPEVEQDRPRGGGRSRVVPVHLSSALLESIGRSSGADWSRCRLVLYAHVKSPEVCWSSGKSVPAA